MAQDEELSLDFTAVVKKLKSLPISNAPEKAITAGIVLAIMLLVLYVRVQPLALPIVDDWALATMQNGIQNQIGAQIRQQYPALPDQNRNQLVQQQMAQFFEQNKAQIEAQRRQIADNIRSRLRYVGEDGKEHTYLGDLDSYFWARYARNWLRTGSSCDITTENGECRDTYVLAPVGQPTSWNPSSHVIAIGILHKIITLFNKNYPLTATSFFVPVLAGLLGVLPAFFIGKRFAGDVGGVFSAVLISLQPLLLSRSMGSDNDVWNVVLPLFAIWFVVEAIESGTIKKNIVYSSLTGITLALHATFWIGWWFTYVVIILALLGAMLFMSARHLLHKQTWQVWREKGIRKTGLTFACTYITTFIGTVPFGSFTTVQYLAIIRTAITSSGSLGKAVADNYWPNVLTTVAELNKSSFLGAVGQMGGKFLFLMCLIGILLIVLPRDIRKWTWHQHGTVVIGVMVYLYLLNTPTGKFTTLAIIGLPILISLTIDLWKNQRIRVTNALLLIGWIMATAYASYAGVRFILLMIPAYGIGVAITAGRLFEWTEEYARKEFKLSRIISSLLVFLVIGSMLITPVKAGYGTARGFVPSISDAWWDTLTHIRQNTSRETIINSWWDFGHWFKYVANRRVTADGTTQGTHVPRWLGLTLITPDERQSIGVLRMLNCGSDAYPTREGKYGAYGTVFGYVNDSIEAEAIVRTLTRLERDEAEAYLAEKRFTPEQIESILNKTHCPPVEDIFITSGDMVGKAGVWAHFGLWNLTRAMIAEEGRRLPRDQAIALFRKRLGMTEAEASQAYVKVRSLPNEGSVNSYVAPWPGYVTTRWRPCSWDENRTVMTCNLALGIANQNNVITSIERVTYRAGNEENTTMTIGFRQNGRIIQTTEEPPTKLIIADEEELREVPTNDTARANIGVLIDLPRNRILLADPALINSMFTKLFYLEGRYNKYYTLFDDRTTFSGSRILSWRVDWDGKEE